MCSHNDWSVINVSPELCACAVEDRGWEDVVCGLSNKLPLTPVEAGREAGKAEVTVRLLEQVGCSEHVHVSVRLCVRACGYGCVLVCEKCACVSFCVCCTGMWKLNGAFQIYCSSPRGWETGCHGYPGILPLMGGSLCSSGNLACVCVFANVCVCFVCAPGVWLGGGSILGHRRSHLWEYQLPVWSYMSFVTGMWISLKLSYEKSILIEKYEHSSPIWDTFDINTPEVIFGHLLILLNDEIIFYFYDVIASVRHTVLK